MDNARVQRKRRKLNKEVEKIFNVNNSLAPQPFLTKNVSQTIKNVQVADLQNDTILTNADSDDSEGSIDEFLDGFFL